MINKGAVMITASALIMAFVAFAAWYRTSGMVRDWHAQIIATELQPIAILLQENQALLHDLQTDPFKEKDSGILESYLVKIRRDGVAKNSQMKQQLDLLAENNTAIVTLIKSTEIASKTPAYRLEADKFRNYASAWRDRWNSVMEVFMEGGNYAVSGVPFPEGFPIAVHAEIAATK
jgi:hypothetical protein